MRKPIASLIIGRGLVLATLSVCLSCVSAPKSQNVKIGENLYVQEITKQSYLITEKTFGELNVLVTKMKDRSVLVISTPYETEGARQLIRWIRNELNPTKIIVINTHFHSDGTGGNDAFHEAGAEIWANDLTDKLYREKAELGKAEEIKHFSAPDLKARIEKRKIVFADNVFKAKDGKKFNFNGEAVVLIYPGPAHTKDNMVVYFPERDILYGTCMIRSGNSLGWTGDADIKSWATSVESIQNLKSKIVIPGHGKMGGWDLVEKTIEIARGASENR